MDLTECVHCNTGMLGVADGHQLILDIRNGSVEIRAVVLFESPESQRARTEDS